MTTAARRAYLTQHGVQPAIATATAKVILYRPADPVVQIGRVLLDAEHVPEGTGGAKGEAALAYVEAHGVTAAVAKVVKKVAEEQPDNPLQMIGKLLIEGVRDESESPSREAVARALSKSLEKRPTASELVDHNILKSSPDSKTSAAVVASKLELEKAMKENQLTKAIGKRPTANELLDQNILKAAPDGKTSAAVMASKIELEKAMKEDQLTKMLEKRPTATELVDHNILKQSPDSKTSAAVVASKIELEKAMKEDKLAKMLEKRPTATELVDHNILKQSPDSKTSAAVVASKLELEDAMKKDSLTKMLQKRPTQSDLIDQKILPADTVEVQ